MLNNLGQLIIITAPSGAGKTTLIKKILEKGDYQFSVSYTTREPRVGEIDGIDYHFITKEDFLNKVNQGDFFAEWATVHTNMYGTAKQESYDLIKTGKSVIFDVDYQGAINLKKVFKEALSVFILPPSLQTLKQRLIDRKTNTEDVINLRVNNAKKEVQYINEFDFLIINDDLNIAFKQLEEIINSNRCSISKNQSFLNSFMDKFLK